MAFASSLDQIGPLTHTVEDAATLLQVIAGHDPLDSTSLDEPVPDFCATLNQGSQGSQNRTPQAVLCRGSRSRSSRSSFAKQLPNWKEQGAEPSSTSTFPPPRPPWPPITFSLPPRPPPTLSRFDGIRYGNRSSKASDIIDTYFKSRSEGFGPEVKRRILLGTYVLSSGYCDEYYIRAQKVRTLIQREFSRRFPASGRHPHSHLPHSSPQAGEADKTRCKTTSQTSTRSQPTWQACPPSLCPAVRSILRQRLPASHRSASDGPPFERRAGAADRSSVGVDRLTFFASSPSSRSCRKKGGCLGVEVSPARVVTRRGKR